MARSAAWGSDTEVSLPKPIDNDVAKVDLGGLCFTPYGIRVDMTEVDREDLRAEAYRPEPLV